MPSVISVVNKEMKRLVAAEGRAGFIRVIRAIRCSLICHPSFLAFPRLREGKLCVFA